MKLAGKSAIFHLSEDGKSVLRHVLGEENYKIATVNTKEAVVTVIEETDDLGVWIRLYERPDSMYFLLRWEFILGIELPANPGNIIGLR